MHVRLSQCLGMVIVVADTQEPLGTLGSLLIHPDTGAIEGIRFSAGGLGRGEHCISSLDIVHWGLRIDVRGADVAGPLDECVRFQDALREGRTMLEQRMVTEGGRFLGRCADVQFDTERFQVEWLFPRTWFRWGRPLPIASVLEVRPDAIVVREAEAPEKQSLLRGEVLKAEVPVAQQCPSPSLAAARFTLSRGERESSRGNWFR